jgi:hypothetical protein
VAAVTPDAFGAAGYVDPHDRRSLGWKLASVRFGTTATGDTWTSTFPIKRIAYVRASSASHQCAATVSADRLTVTFTSSATMTAPRYMVWY